MLVNVLRRGGEGRDEEAREQIRHLGPPGDVHHRPHQQRSLPVNIFDHFYGDKAVQDDRGRLAILLRPVLQVRRSARAGSALMHPVSSFVTGSTC